MNDSKESSEAPALSGLKISIFRAYDQAMANFDFAKVAAHTGRDVLSLHDELSKLLRDFLSDYPNINEMISNGWHLRLVDRSFGIRAVEIHFPVAWESQLIVDFNESKEAIALGLLDEEGEPTHPAPACWHCKRPHAPQPIAGVTDLGKCQYAALNPAVAPCPHAATGKVGPGHFCDYHMQDNYDAAPGQ